MTVLAAAGSAGNPQLAAAALLGIATVVLLITWRFRLVKEHFGMSVGDTIKSWSVMETIIRRRPGRGPAARPGDLTPW